MRDGRDKPATTSLGITANKREETVQDVAVAVTAISADNKQELGIITVTDLTNVTPGLSYTPGNERVTLRGIGRLSNSFGAVIGVLASTYLLLPALFLTVALLGGLHLGSRMQVPGRA